LSWLRLVHRTQALLGSCCIVSIDTEDILRLADEPTAEAARKRQQTRHRDIQTYQYAGIARDKHMYTNEEDTGGQTDKRTDRQAEKQADRQTGAVRHTSIIVR